MTTEPAPVNEALRAHVTSAKFVLTLGGSHIAALVWIDWNTRHGPSMSAEPGAVTQHHKPAHGPWRFIVPGCNGIIDRGLAVHHPFRNSGSGIDERPFGQAWQITPAGQAVITLLREAGIWDEYLAHMPVLERAHPTEPEPQPNAVLEAAARRAEAAMAAESDRFAAPGDAASVEQGMGVARAMAAVLAAIRNPQP